ncbi:HPF/RaiA family ribosome-associated protein [Patescibacteria group bacterium]|nr:HPF/RaiA family ribosome-associated protein [Patescibacteria group bacterium]
MEIKYETQNYILTDAEKSFINDKLQSLRHFLDKDTVVYVKIIEEKTKLYKIEISLTYNNIHIRALKSGSKFYDLVELTIHTLKSNIERVHDKSHDYFEGKKSWTDFENENIDDKSFEDYRPIIKVKEYSDNTPMHPQEAIERMTLLGHKSFLFKNIETGKYAMVYIRDDGISFGLITPKDL